MNKLGLWWVFIILVAMEIAGFITAQSIRTASPTVRVVSGSDVGFRIDGADHQGRPMGSVVVQVNGEWLEGGSVSSAQSR